MGGPIAHCGETVRRGIMRPNRPGRCLGGIEWETGFRIPMENREDPPGREMSKTGRTGKNLLRCQCGYGMMDWLMKGRPSPGGRFDSGVKLRCRREGEKRMSLEAIEKITQVEAENRERKAAAEAEAQKIVADAEREGQALLQRTRSSAAENGKELLRQAEAKAAERSAEIDRTAQAEAAALRETAGQHLSEAAEFIVGRVVKH